MTDEVVTEEAELDPLNDAPASLEASQATEETPAESSPAVEANEEQDNVQKRINKLTAQKYEEKRGRQTAEARVAELEGAKPALPSEAPKLEDFDFDETRHNEAVITYQVQKQLNAQSAQQTQQAADTARQAVLWPTVKWAPCPRKTTAARKRKASRPSAGRNLKKQTRKEAAA